MQTTYNIDNTTYHFSKETANLIKESFSKIYNLQDYLSRLAPFMNIEDLESAVKRKPSLIVKIANDVEKIEAESVEDLAKRVSEIIAKKR